MRRDDIAELFASFKEGRVYADEWQLHIHEPLEKEAWLLRLAEHAAKLNELYTRNAEISKRVLQPMLKEPSTLSDDDFDCLYDWMRDMYLEDYDDPFTLREISTLLIDHYERKKDVDHLIFVYQCTAYASLEISRTGDRVEGRRSVRYYRKLLQFKSRFAAFENPANRVSIFVAFSNLLRTEPSLGNLSQTQVYQVWRQFERFDAKPENRAFDDAQPRLTELREYFSNDFKAYCADSYYEEQLKRDGSFKKRFSRQLYDTLMDISFPYLEQMLNAPDADLGELSDLYCNYQRLLVLKGRQSWNDAWHHIDSICRKLVHQSTVSPTRDFDAIAATINPIVRSVTILGQTDLSAERRNQIVLEYSHIISRFSLENRTGQYFNAANSALASFYNAPALLANLSTAEDKLQLMLKFVVTRHAVTYVHSTIVSKAALLMLDSIFAHCPEQMIGVCGARSALDVLRRRDDIRTFTERAALLHDIGKNSLIDVITTDHRMINDLEFAAIKRHPKLGADSLSLDAALRPYRDVAFGHHKFYNGLGGYPAEFDNRVSPIKPLIDLVTICDCMDAATDFLGRNYHRAKTLEQVREELKQGSGVRYHPRFVALLSEDRTLFDRLDRLVSVERRDVYYGVYRQFFTDAETAS